MKNKELEKSKKTVLEDDFINLICTYKLFYKEMPDFSDENINLKIQSMVFILANFRIMLGNYKFAMFNYNTEKVPFSANLHYVIEILKSLGKQYKINKTTEFREDIEKTIKIIRDCLNEMVNEKQNLTDVLISLSRTLYTQKSNYLSEEKIDRISEIANLSNDKVRESLKLVRKIKTDLHK